VILPVDKRIKLDIMYVRMRGKNGFTEISKNLAKYKSENNFVWTIKIIMRDTQLARMLKLSTALSSLEHSTLIIVLMI